MGFHLCVPSQLRHASNSLDEKKKRGDKEEEVAEKPFLLFPLLGLEKEKEIRDSQRKSEKPTPFISSMLLSSHPISRRENEKMLYRMQAGFRCR